MTTSRRIGTCIAAGMVSVVIFHGVYLLAEETGNEAARGKDAENLATRRGMTPARSGLRGNRGPGQNHTVPSP